MKYRFLNGNIVKIIAAITMFIDHMGMFLFPNIALFRIIGRLSMPLFAFLIAEGCRYTHDKFRYLALIAALSVVYAAAFYYVFNYIYLSIFSTFTISILLIYALQNFKKSVFCGEGFILSFLNGLIFVALVAFTYALNQITCFGDKKFVIDYGFWGCMLPVFASLCDLKGIVKEKAGWVDCYYLRFALFAMGLIIACIHLVSVVPTAYYAIFALDVLFFYNEKKGKYNLKYFFYLFYPLHMALLFFISLLMSGGLFN